MQSRSLFKNKDGLTEGQHETLRVYRMVIPNLRQRGNTFIGRCPVHGDHKVLLKPVDGGWESVCVTHTSSREPSYAFAV